MSCLKVHNLNPNGKILTNQETINNDQPFFNQKLD